VKKTLAFLGFILLVSGVAHASNDNWMIFARASSTSWGNGGLACTFAVSTAASDGHDSLDTPISLPYTPGNLARCAFYRTTWPSPQWYLKDTKLPVGAGQTKYWTKLYIWIESGFYDQAQGRTTLRFSTWLSTSAYAIAPGLRNYDMLIVDDPTGQHEGETYHFTQSYGGASNNPVKYWDWNLAAAGEKRSLITADSLEDASYKHIEVWLMVTPEPSSLLILASGAIGLAGFALKRRR